MARRLEFHPLADREVDAAWKWYAERSLQAAQRFAEELDQAVQSICDHSEWSPRYLAGTRCCLLKRYPYLVVFRERPDDLIEVVAVSHAKRRPGYWKRRL
jgi:plasmid stabilization system protein ParE